MHRYRDGIHVPARSMIYRRCSPWGSRPCLGSMTSRHASGSVWVQPAHQCRRCKLNHVLLHLRASGVAMVVVLGPSPTDPNRVLLLAYFAMLVPLFDRFFLLCRLVSLGTLSSLLATTGCSIVACDEMMELSYPSPYRLPAHCLGG